MDWISFKSFINKLNVNYFDGELRVAHWRFNHLTKKQTGGGKNINPIKPTNIINKLSNNQIKILVDSLVIGNVERINFIVNNYL